ncbi:MAG: TspO/MBR family protein [candidate division WOR-3 bacterium]
MYRSKINEILNFFISIIICQFAGLIGSLFTTPSIPGWYANINKPSFTPPNWVFAPVWTILFLLMGISLYFILRIGLSDKNVRIAIMVFILQLAFNILWSFLFFGLRSPFLAFVEIIFLWIAILMTIILFYSLSKVAGILLIPYILWVSFASVLNFAIWKMG